MTIAPRPRVYAVEALTSEALALAEKHFDLVKHSDPNFADWRERAEGLLVRNAYITPGDVEVMARHKLRYISKQGVGVDNFDLDSLRKHGIPLMNTPGVNAQAVAELAFGLIMSVARGITTIDRRIRAGDAVTKLDGWNGQTLQGRTIGIIGGGNIGLLLARMFHLSFGGKMVLYDPYLKDLATWHSSMNPDDLRRVSSIDEICETADIISIHVPLTAETNNCISTRQFELMKSSAILINSARGGIVDEAALQVALESGEIFGAGLDAFVSEPPSSAAYAGLCKLPNVVMTPHIGAATEAAQQATSTSMVQHLVEAFQGSPLRDRVC